MKGGKVHLSVFSFHLYKRSVNTKIYINGETQVSRQDVKRLDYSDCGDREGGKWSGLECPLRTER